MGNTLVDDFRKVILAGHFDFTEMALRIFRYQAEKVLVYAKWCKLQKVDVYSVNTLEQIPFLPISLFKSHDVLVPNLPKVVKFESSGTTGMIPSVHYLDNLDFYNELSQKIYEEQFGKLEGTVILALLPHYLERGQSSLVAMVKHFMEIAGEVESGFFLHDFQALFTALHNAKMFSKRVILFGVTYALLDAAEEAKEKLGDNVVIIETGGMKGRHKEMVRQEVHAKLKELWGATVIRSEYGMTELLSQGYTHEGEIFKAGYTLQVLRRMADDPKNISTSAGKGVYNLIDLANVHSCAFIASDDQGTLFADGSFTVEGRIDHADVRGCNLLSLT
jgi:phenylacetate-coenzyme A ligase PaaK-like adenylate-forming protein